MIADFTTKNVKRYYLSQNYSRACEEDSIKNYKSKRNKLKLLDFLLFVLFGKKTDFVRLDHSNFSEFTMFIY